MIFYAMKKQAIIYEKKAFFRICIWLSKTICTFNFQNRKQNGLEVLGESKVWLLMLCPKEAQLALEYYLQYVRECYSVKNYSYRFVPVKNSRALFLPRN